MYFLCAIFFNYSNFFHIIFTSILSCTMITYWIAVPKKKKIAVQKNEIKQ